MIRAGRAFSFVRPLLHTLDAERAHQITIKALKLLPRAAVVRDTTLATSVCGIEFPNPLGLAAGFDKNGEVPDAMLAMGFGFVEVGSVTPKPQAGNSRPRLFRLAEDEAVINRMGFNNEGHAVVLERLRRRSAAPGLVAVNLGANKDSGDPVADYIEGWKQFSDVAAFITVNISSPNTPGLRALQAVDELDDLLSRLAETRKHLRPVPLVLKLAPDLSNEELSGISAICLARKVDAIAMSNTTISRPNLHSHLAHEQGGLSGKPLFPLSTRNLAKLRLLTKGRIPLIGIGGISGVETAWTKILAGASLLQLYSALVYKGPELVPEILRGIAQRTIASGCAHFSEAVGTQAEAIATRD